MKETFLKVKNGAIIVFAVLGALSIVTTFVRHRIAKRLIKEQELDVSEAETK